MGRINEQYRYNTTPQCNPKAVVKGDKYRFTILTPSLVRMEYSEKGIFEDRATSVVVNREFDVPWFEVCESDDMLTIYTKRLEISYRKNNPFHESSLMARFSGEWGYITNEWRFQNSSPLAPGGKVRNYWGTAKALDECVCPIPLEKGILSPDFSEWDDSKSSIIAEDGWIEERPEGTVDTYLFAYSHNEILCINDFLQLTGKIPMLPRYALGNWWSRYHKYTEDEYKAVINKFAEKDIPLSVAVSDMDWHITKIDKEFGSGWTGYTWNKELYPNPEEFINWIHNQGLELTLNIHDREGVGPHEENYLAMAKELGVDYKNKKVINFDFADPKYVEAYFKYLRHPNEDMGVSFWWVDGFPENNSNYKKVNYPWLMNHFNYIDQLRNGKRAMLLSRNCGMGGHRYGIGFSGDTFATWETLDFLPYFTSTAANVGFGWWSHDVGGFMGGDRDDELMVRWLQFSVFSPICRLHSTNNPFLSKEPWNYNEVAEKVISAYMRLRHELIPYIYTMNYKSYADNLPIVRPIYYYCKCHGKKNEYYFGDNIIVAPITKKMDPVTNMGNFEAYLPEGIWFDFFTARKYTGDREIKLYRDIYNIPVFVKAGGIIPQAVLEGKNFINNPKQLKIDIFPGEDGEFELYEDDNVSLNYENGDCVKTKLKWNWTDKQSFIIEKPIGNLSYIPEKRNYILHFKKISDCEDITVMQGDKEVKFEKIYNNEEIVIKINGICDRTVVNFNEKVNMIDNNIDGEIDAFLMKMQISNNQKWNLSKLIHEGKIANVLTEISKEEYDCNFRNALTEFLLSAV